MFCETPHRLSCLNFLSFWAQGERPACSILMGTQVYEVPLVFQDLRSAESYLQLFDALANLQAISDEVFGRISARVREERSRVESINMRLAGAASRVQQVRTAMASRATRVHSPAKYPHETLHTYKPIHPVAEIRSVVRSTAAARALLREVPHAGPLVRDTEFHALVAEAPQSALDQRAAQVQQGLEGLGRLPSQVASVSSLLLFNTASNPYKKYVSLDNLAVGPEGPEAPPEESKALSAAPKTVAEGEVLPEGELEQWTYRPVLGQVPEFNLPASLPNLPMVAQDLLYTATSSQDLPAIAPSLPPALPTLDQLQAQSAAASSSSSAPVPASASASAPAATTPSSSAPAPAAPAPPPPPAAPAPPPPPSAPAPPPPPLANVPPEVAAPDSGRSSLLEDIRRGHMHRLRKVRKDGDEDRPARGGGKSKEKGKGKKVDADADDAHSAAKKKSAPASTGDILSDLVLALNRRRMNMGGRGDPSKSKPKAQEEVDAGSDTEKLPEWEP